ncbi:MAG: tetratricopeptide repeat protein [Myxococcales bacterium]|nr:tetratricopeptide repeat protein [Myxococcales bacterium]
MSGSSRKQRIEALEGMLAADPDDGFALYGLAMEHKADEAFEAAEPLLRRLIGLDPGHHYAYFQLGELLIADGRSGEAEAVLQAGIARAKAQGEAKAARELMALLDEL